MDDREQAYWIEGENYPNDKYYFTGDGASERFLQYLRDNDPCVCGALVEALKEINSHQNCQESFRLCKETLAKHGGGK